MKESTPSHPTLSIGAVIDQRFKVEAELSESLGQGAYLAEDQETGAKCIVFGISDIEKPALEAMANISHAHLAKVLAIVTAPEGTIVAAERVVGESLAQLLARIGKKQPVDAVRSALRLADALSIAHQSGAFHGRVHPKAVIVEPEGRAGPVLALGGRLEDESFYQSPDRGQQGPSEHDDSWAVAALLLKMLTGNDPPSDGFESEAELERQGVTDPMLQTALLRALHSDPAERNEGLRPFKRDLARWFVEHAGEEPLSHHALSSSPPPLPHGAERHPPAVASSTSAPGPRGKSRLPFLAAGGLVFGLGAAWAASSLISTPEPPVEEPPAPASSAAPRSSTEEIDLGEVDIAGESDTDIDADNKLSSCVASYLPEKSFDKAPDLRWVCSVDSPRKGTDQLRAAVVSHAPGRQVSTAMKLFSRMGWYDMVLFSVVRAGCCPEAAQFKLPDPSPGCERMDALLAAIGQQVVDGQDFQAALDRFTASAQCEAKAGYGARFKQPEPPGGGEREAFIEYTGLLK